jgi:hypothetical protein
MICLGNVFPSLVSEKRQDAAVIAGDIRSATIQSMKSDSNIAQTELKSDKLEEMFPEPAKLLGFAEEGRATYEERGEVGRVEDSVERQEARALF